MDSWPLRMERGESCRGYACSSLRSALFPLVFPGWKRGPPKRGPPTKNFGRPSVTQALFAQAGGASHGFTPMSALKKVTQGSEMEVVVYLGTLTKFHNVATPILLTRTAYATGDDHTTNRGSDMSAFLQSHHLPKAAADARSWNTWTSNMPNIMDPVLLILSMLGYWGPLFWALWEV